MKPSIQLRELSSFQKRKLVQEWVGKRIIVPEYFFLELIDMAIEAETYNKRFYEALDQNEAKYKLKTT